MRQTFAAIIAVVAIAGAFAAPALACGMESDCAVGERTYRLHVDPSLGDGPVGALVYAHGYRGTAAGAMRNAALRALAAERGMALVALKSEAEDWNLAHRPRAPGQARAAEAGYVADVLADVAGRVDLDEARLVMTGFSAGGMMTWTIACGMGAPFAGFVPMSGTFWAPVPAGCAAAPVPLVHVHGTGDDVVPMGGRAIGETRQGDVHAAVAMYRDHAGAAPGETVEAPGGMRCETTEGAVVDLCTFAGGHGFSTERLGWGIARVLGE